MAETAWRGKALDAGRRTDDGSGPIQTGTRGMTDASVTIFHNPACGTSRKTLERIRAAGIEPNVVEYLKAGWTKAELKKILKLTGMSARDIMRVRGTPAEELKLTDPKATEDQIIDAMVGHPILVERPIVITPKGAVLARPMEKVEEIL
jgi:arsenate reductase